MTRTQFWSLLLAAFLLAGCFRPDPNPRFRPAWQKVDTGGEGWERTKTALLVADCQFHNLEGEAVPERNISTKAAIKTAIRAPQLDLFSPDVLAWILKNGAPEAEVVLHLGDSIDLACDGEYMTFLEVMEGTDKPWFMAPGNHDAFYFGNFHPERDDVWKRACKGSQPLTKDRFIGLYVAALVRQKGPSFEALASALGVAGDRERPVKEIAKKLPDSFDWTAADDATGYLRRIAWKRDKQRPWRSYIIQMIDLTDPASAREMRVLLLDSCQYGRQPQMVPNGWRSYPIHHNCGATGEMLPDQLRKAREWVHAFRRVGREASREVVLMCHHPFDGLARRSRSSLGWLWREYALGMLVTAHTHAGYYAHHDLGGKRDEIELNIGSTTDWPMEWRTLTSYVNANTSQIYLESKRGTLVEALQKREGFFQAGWEIPLDAPDDYRKYKQIEDSGAASFLRIYGAYHLVPYWLPQPLVTPTRGAWSTEVQIKDTLLWTYARLVKLFPTDHDDAQPAIRWPKGCSTDKQVLERIATITKEREAEETLLKIRRKTTKAQFKEQLEEKVEFLAELEKFERSRKTKDPKTGRSLDQPRVHFKISQAAWASRFEAAEGRRLRIEDELVEVDWKRDIKLPDSKK